MKTILVSEAVKGAMYRRAGKTFLTAFYKVPSIGKDAYITRLERKGHALLGREVGLLREHRANPELVLMQCVFKVGRKAPSDDPNFKPEHQEEETFYALLPADMPLIQVERAKKKKKRRRRNKDTGSSPKPKSTDKVLASFDEATLSGAQAKAVAPKEVTKPGRARRRRQSEVQS